MNGIPAEAHLGKSVGELVPGIIASVEPVFRQVLETGEAIKDMLIEGETPKAPGVRRAWLESWFPVSDSIDGKPSGVGVVVQEVTDRLRAERQLRESQEALKETDRKKDEFLATLAHELRNPLAPLRNCLELLRLSQGRIEARTLRMMDRQLNQLVRLIDDLLDVSRIASGKLELRKERIALETVVEAAIETSRPIIEASNHTLAVELPPDILVNADRIRLAQVFSNLLNNAAKYTEPGGEIRLSARQQDGEVVVTVEDSGVGIPAGMLTGVFELFAQVDRSLERSQGGLGIGLTLAKRLSEMHGGSVEARSEGEGKGSTFTVRLPAAVALPSIMAPEAAGRAEAVPKRRVLIADDNEDSAVSLAELLELRGNEVQTAGNGLEAVEKAAAFRPDVILLDIGMPILNGYDAARRIREQPWGGNVRLIAVTGWGQEEDKRRAWESGFDHHLVKPVDVRILETLLAQSETVEA
jgi:signal transduction histidine kinase/ActR/RegA family two-component response regulator